ncbi:MAG TPA: GGDEF domain-containing protein [Bryobacteraceae bacterium]|nr:GGDEF domain-containing protein [Bryobacteraceae bacterium]
MISIRSSLAELEKCHQERDAAVDCYVAAIKSLAHYTIELEPAITEPQRQYLNSLADDAASGKPEVLGETRATLRGLLRDYRDKTAHYLERLRQELEGMASALEQIMSSLSQSDGEHESHLRAALGRLRDFSRSPEGSAVRTVVMSAVDAIDVSLEQMRKEHQLKVSQLQVEMGVLHKRIDSLEAAASLDQLTELYNRREMEERIRAAASPYCLLLARVTGIRLAEIQFRPEVAAELTAAFTRRLRNSLPPDAVIGRWGNEEFAAMLFISTAEATTVARSIAEQLSGAYACLLAGKTVRPSLQLSVAIVDSEGASPDRILQRVKGFLTSG